MKATEAITAVDSATPPVTARLRCTLTNSPENETIPSTRSNITIPIWFRQEEGKKASFVIDPPSTLSDSSASNSSEPSKKALHHGLEKPAHAIIECCCIDDMETENNGKNGNKMSGRTTSPTVPFLFAGMEIISNSRNIETYSTDEEGNEKYLFTSRGMKVEYDDEICNAGTVDIGIPQGIGNEPPPKPEWYKCVMINPGGPERLKRLHLKLLSLRPARATRVNIGHLKLKGRILTAEDLKANLGLAAKKKSNESSTPPPNAMSAEKMGMLKNTLMGKGMASSSFPASMPNINAAKPGPAPTATASQSDMGSAIAAVTMMVRSTEERLTRSVTTSIGALEKTTTSSFRFMELKIQSMEKALAVQKETMDEQEKLIREQSRMLESQREMMEAMIEGQKVLLESVTALQKQEEAKETTAANPDIVESDECNEANLSKKLEETSTSEGDKRVDNKKSTRGTNKTSEEINAETGKECTEVVENSLSNNAVVMHDCKKPSLDEHVARSSIMNESQNNFIPDPFAALAEEDLLGFGDENDFDRRASTNANDGHIVDGGGEIQDLLGFSDDAVEVSAVSKKHEGDVWVSETIPNETVNNNSPIQLVKEHLENSNDDTEKDEGSVYESVVEYLGLSLGAKKRQDEFFNKNKEEHSTMTIPSYTSIIDRDGMKIHRGGEEDDKNIGEAKEHGGGSMYTSITSFGSAGVDNDITDWKEEKAVDTAKK